MLGSASELCDALCNLPLTMADYPPHSGEKIFLVCSAEDFPAAHDYLQTQKVEIAAICLFDRPDRSCCPDTISDGTSVVPLDALASFPDARPLLFSSDYFSVPVHSGSGCLAARALAAHTASFSLVPKLEHTEWHARAFPDLYKRFGKQLDTVYTRLADTESRLAFAQAVKMLLTGNPGYVRPAPFDQYFHPATQVLPGDIVVDGGTHSIQETLHFARVAQEKGMVLCFEPEPALFAALRETAGNLPEKLTVRPLPFALGAESFSCFIVSNDAGSWVTRRPREGALPVTMRDLDSVLCEENIDHVDVIKLDIEGCEVDALRGAAECIRRDRPRLMISAYHKMDDIIAIPELLWSLVPEYTLHFACHEMLVGEFLYYAHV